MGYSNKYGGVIWTNHAMERLQSRALKQDLAWQAYRYPDSETRRKDGSVEFLKRFGNHTVTTIAKQNENREWIIISTWVDPPFAGTEDARKKERYHKYRKATFWGKIWMSVLKQIGL